jgi:ABC transport system ATP-binding/permease protein
MSEPILKALMQLFALISDIHEDTVITSREKAVVKLFLTRHLNNELVIKYMTMFEGYLGLFNSENITKGSREDRKRVSLNAMRILAICEKINEELQQKQKIYVLVKLMDYISLGEEITENELDFLQTVANAFNISEEEYHNIRYFIMGSINEMPDKSRVLVINGNKKSDIEIKHVFNENLRGSIFFLNIPSTNTYLMRYSGNEDLYLSGQNILAGETYIFDSGSSIRGSGIDAILYTEVVGIITESSFDFRISLDAVEVSFTFKKSENGIHNLNFHEETGRLVGIIGGSGVGKSTTLSILNGTLKPQSGDVLINGFNLYDEHEKENLKGVIGFVPQDDLLIEDLTVWQNLYYNAKMCLNNLSGERLVEVVNKTLTDLDLEETRDLKVGNPLKKIISGGQRKRVNIALELIREPTVLFVDEPTSGLSSIDSEMVMNLLKELTYKGKLVVVNIHQPGSELYKMFDKIMIIDKGGYQIYYGDPTEAIVYFKIHSFHANPFEDQCTKCGNIDTDQILQIVEAKVIDEQGRATRIRKITPKEWVQKFREKSPAVTAEKKTMKQELPENFYSIPGLLKQSKIFFIRDLLSKLADHQYILISLFGSPFLALILAYFSRYEDKATYTFSQNGNIPPYLFMCVITSLFFGLMISSDEIVKDRKILKRESFLNLSWFSYLNSKVLILFIFSAIQTFLFVLIGNLILDIRGMLLPYWLVLFSTSCFANITGLLISSAFNSVITIYIIIPFFLIPQLLFSGVFVNFDKLNTVKGSAHEYVPIIGDVMVSRWSFEAIAVEQFKNNRYEKPFFKNDMEKSQNEYYGSYLTNILKTELHLNMKYQDSDSYQEVIKNNFNRLDSYTRQLSNIAGLSYPVLLKTAFNNRKIDSMSYREAYGFLDTLTHIFNRRVINGRRIKDTISGTIESKIGKGGLSQLKDEYENIRLREYMLEWNELSQKAIEMQGKIVQKFEPGFMKALSRTGQAHFYAPVKRLGNFEIGTYWFNLAVVWLGSILLYILLFYDLPRKLMEYFGNLRFPKYDI